MANFSAVDLQSLTTLSTQVPQHLTWIILGSIGVLTNLPIAITIVLSKILRDKSQFVILSHCIATIVNCATNGGTGLARYLAYALVRPETSTQSICVLKQLPMHLTSFLLRTCTCALAFDRFLCMCAPLFYKNRRPLTYVGSMNVVCWGLCVIKACVVLLDSYDATKLVPVCTRTTTFKAAYTNYATIEDDIIVSITVFLYVATASILLYRYKKAAIVSSSQKSEWRKRMEFDVFVAMAMVGIIYLLTFGGSTVTSSIVAAYPSLDLNLKMAPFTSGLVYVSSISNLFVYLKFSRKFRRAFKGVFMRKFDTTSTVVPVTLVKSRGQVQESGKY